MDFRRAREQMVEQQLVPRGIDDQLVLAVMRKVPRHLFVPEDLQEVAYGDFPLSIGEGQTISQPYMVALMTQLLRLKPTDRVLEVGTGSGYQAAILAELAHQVFTIERIPELSQRAEKLLHSLGYANIFFRAGNGTLGWEEFAPYHKIMVTAGAPEVPESLLRQLADGGRIVIPIGNTVTQVLTLVEKIGKQTQKSEICGCVFVPLIGQEGWQYE